MLAACYRATLLAGLTVVSALTALCGSIAVQLMKSRNPGMRPQAMTTSQTSHLSGSQAAVLEQGVPSVPSTSAESPVEEIPIGIAWEEMRREKVTRGNSRKREGMKLNRIYLYARARARTAYGIHTSRRIPRRKEYPGCFGRYHSITDSRIVGPIQLRIRYFIRCLNTHEDVYSGLSCFDALLG